MTGFARNVGRQRNNLKKFKIIEKVCEGVCRIVHYVEDIYEASKNPAHGHFQDPEESRTHKEEHKETKGGDVQHNK